MIQIDEYALRSYALSVDGVSHCFFFRNDQYLTIRMIGPGWWSEKSTFWDTLSFAEDPNEICRGSIQAMHASMKRMTR